MRKLAFELFVAIALTLGSILASTPGVLASDDGDGAFARLLLFTAKAGTV
jgi:hypothetical protein